jgi:hypothetical protein
LTYASKSSRMSADTRDEPAGQITGDPVAPSHRPAGSAGLTTAVGGGDDVFSQHRGETVDVAAAGGVQEAFDDRPPVGGIRPEPRRLFVEPLAGAPMQLARIGFGCVKDVGDVGVALSECLPQHERGTLGGGQPFHQCEQRDGHGVALFDRFQRTQCAVGGEDGLGKPRTGIGFATGTGGGELIEAEVGHGRGQPCGQRSDGCTVRLVEAKVGVLYRVFGLARRSEQSVREPKELRPVYFEFRGEVSHYRQECHGIMITGQFRSGGGARG